LAGKLESVEEIEDFGVAREEGAVVADTVLVKVGEAFERTAGLGAVVVDGAEVVWAEELALAVNVGEDVFGAECAVGGSEGGGDSEGLEAGKFVVLQEGGVGVAVLLAAGGVAEVAGGGAEDGEANGHLSLVICHLSLVICHWSLVESEVWVFGGVVAIEDGGVVQSPVTNDQ
jgi:hypothetical protein